MSRQSTSVGWSMTEWLEFDVIDNDHMASIRCSVCADVCKYAHLLLRPQNQ